MKWHHNVRYVFRRLVEEVAHDATHHRLRQLSYGHTCKLKAVRVSTLRIIDDKENTCIWHYLLWMVVGTHNR